MKITIELNKENQHDKVLIDFLEEQGNTMKKFSQKQALQQGEILRQLITKPTESSKQKIKKVFISALSEEAKLNAIHKSYSIKNKLDISLADFSLNHLSNIKPLQRSKYLNDIINNN